MPHPVLNRPLPLPTFGRQWFILQRLSSYHKIVLRHQRKPSVGNSFLISSCYLESQSRLSYHSLGPPWSLRFHLLQDGGLPTGWYTRPKPNRPRGLCYLFQISLLYLDRGEIQITVSPLKRGDQGVCISLSVFWGSWYWLSDES